MCCLVGADKLISADVLSHDADISIAIQLIVSLRTTNVREQYLKTEIPPSIHFCYIHFCAFTFD